MVEITVELDETRLAGLRRLPAQSGMSEGELIREAVDRYLAKEDRLTRLERAFGAWADDDEAETIVADNRQPADERLARLLRQWHGSEC